MTQSQGLSDAEIDAATAETLPEREQMSLVNANAAVPVNAALAANVLSDESTARPRPTTRTTTSHSPTRAEQHGAR